jgi:molybdopterin synthase sulfur carrier subunit
MSLKIIIPTALRPLTENAAAVEVEASTVKEALDQLCSRFDGLGRRLFKEGGQLNRFVNVYINDEDIRYLADLDTPVKSGDSLSIVPAIAGG